MIEYELSISVRCSRDSVNRILQNLPGGITAIPSRQNADSLLLEARSPYVGCQIDFAINHFLDSIAPIQDFGEVVAAGLKVCALFDPEKIAALNFELDPETVARLARLRCGLDVWAMPAG